MPENHQSALLQAENIYFQALCTCGWCSIVSFKEEVDLLRALHVHLNVVFNNKND
jgi:hypothetical protein